jgi:hypothetical protein
VFLGVWIGIACILLLIGLVFIIWRTKKRRDPATRAIDESLQRIKKCLSKGTEQKALQAAPQPKCLPLGASAQKSLTSGDSEQKSIEPTTCPICGAPAEKAYLYGPESTLTQGISGETVSEKNITAATGKSETADSHEVSPRPCAEVLRCSSCKRIILEYGNHDSDPKPSPRQLAWEPETK